MTGTATTLDFNARYRVAGYGGVAWRLIEYEQIRDEDYEWTGIAEENRSNVRAVMVGDDCAFTIDVDDLTLIDEDDYCHECGQIGCKADGRN